MSDLNVESEEIEEAWLVCFGDDEGWHPSMGHGLFFSYGQAEEFVKAHISEPGHHFDWTIMRCLPFKLEVVNDVFDQENPPKGTSR